MKYLKASKFKLSVTSSYGAENENIVRFILLLSPPRLPISVFAVFFSSLFVVSLASASGIDDPPFDTIGSDLADATYEDVISSGGYLGDSYFRQKWAKLKDPDLSKFTNDELWTLAERYASRLSYWYGETGRDENSPDISVARQSYYNFLLKERDRDIKGE